MRLSFRFLAMVVAAVWLAGCNGLGGTGGFAGTPELAPIVYEYTFAMATFSQQVKISADGQMDIIQVTGSAAKDRQVVRTQLTGEQKAEIVRAFRGWNNLKHTYPAYFGPIISISFDGYKVEAGDNDNAAPEVKNAKAAMDKAVKAAMEAGRPAAPAVAAGAAVPALESDVEYRYDLVTPAGPTMRRRVTVNKAGILQVTEAMTGANVNEQPIAAAVQLPPAQMGLLVNALRQLPAGNVQFGPGAEGAGMQVTYAGRTLGTGGTGEVPASFVGVQSLLESYAQVAKNAVAGR